MLHNVRIDHLKYWDYTILKKITLFIFHKKKIMSNYNLNNSKILFLDLRMNMLRSSITGYVNKDF